MRKGNRKWEMRNGKREKDNGKRETENRKREIGIGDWRTGERELEQEM